MSPATLERGVLDLKKTCHVWACHITHPWVMPRTKESCHVWMHHVTSCHIHINETCHISSRPAPYERGDLCTCTPIVLFAEVLASRQISMSHDTWQEAMSHTYGVATISRLLKIIGLFCKRALSNRQYSAKETCDFKERTNRSHPLGHHA